MHLENNCNPAYFKLNSNKETVSCKSWKRKYFSLRNQFKKRNQSEKIHNYLQQQFNGNKNDKITNSTNARIF